jgi:hypothetical protein
MLMKRNSKPRKRQAGRPPAKVKAAIPAETPDLDETIDFANLLGNPADPDAIPDLDETRKTLEARIAALEARIADRDARIAGLLTGIVDLLTGKDRSYPDFANLANLLDGPTTEGGTS